MTLFSGLGSTNGFISSGVPQRALPYSMFLRHFFAFFFLKYTISQIAAAPASPQSRSRGWTLGSGSRPKSASPFTASMSFIRRERGCDSGISHSLSI